MSLAIYRLQQAVREGGYYSGRLDGEWTPALSAATSRFLIARGQPLDPRKPFNGLARVGEQRGLTRSNSSSPHGPPRAGLFISEGKEPT
jgi:hypothetical protein